MVFSCVGDIVWSGLIVFGWWVYFCLFLYIYFWFKFLLVLVLQYIIGDDDFEYYEVGWYLYVCFCMFGFYLGVCVM